MGAIYILWLRELKRYIRSRVQVVASLGQPCLYLLALGFGLGPVSSSPHTVDLKGVFMIRDGERAGESFVVDRPVLTIGCGSESDIVINDTSISRRHVQILHEPNGIYVRDLESRNGTRINDEPLYNPQLLVPGDTIYVGRIRLEFTLFKSQPSTPLPLSFMPPPVVGGPSPLRLPSKPQQR